jgi:transcriptional regulator with XRE-family HTH domain
MNFGSHFVEFLKRRKISQTRAAELLNWSQPTVHYYCHLKNPPRPHALTHIAKCLGVTEAELLGGAAVRESGGAYQAVDPWASWGKQLRAAWRRDPAKVELAVRSAWPKAMAEEIIAWLAKEK